MYYKKREIANNIAGSFGNLTYDNYEITTVFVKENYALMNKFITMGITHISDEAIISNIILVIYNISLKFDLTNNAIELESYDICERNQKLIKFLVDVLKLYSKNSLRVNRTFYILSCFKSAGELKFICDIGIEILDICLRKYVDLTEFNKNIIRLFNNLSNINSNTVILNRFGLPIFIQRNIIYLNENERSQVDDIVQKCH